MWDLFLRLYLLAFDEGFDINDVRLFGILYIGIKVVYTFCFFEPQNIEQEISNVEMIPSKFCGSLFCGSIFKMDD